MKTLEDQLRAIIDTIPVLAWSARPEGSAEFFNRRWLDYAGLSIEEARDWGWTAAVHPDDLSRLTDYWRSILASGEPGEIEARLRRFDGEYRWFLFRAEPLRDDLGNIIKWYGTNCRHRGTEAGRGACLAAEKRTLEMIAGGARLEAILESLCATIDAQAGNSISAVMLTDADGMRLWPAASPRASPRLDRGHYSGQGWTWYRFVRLCCISEAAGDRFRHCDRPLVGRLSRRRSKLRVARRVVSAAILQKPASAWHLRNVLAQSPAALARLICD